jgi:hypothetical protein
MKNTLLSLVLMSSSAAAGVGHCPKSYTCLGNPTDGRPCVITDKEDMQNGLFPMTVFVPAGVSSGVMKLTKEVIWYGNQVTCHYNPDYNTKHDLFVMQNKATPFVKKQLAYAWSGDTCIYNSPDAVSACQFLYK